MKLSWVPGVGMGPAPGTFLWTIDRKHICLWAGGKGKQENRENKMTIKNKIRLSNILMLVIPLAVTMAAVLLGRCSLIGNY